MKEVAILLFILLLAGCSGSSSPSDTASPSSLVKSMSTITRNGKSLDWCHANNKIACEKMGKDLYFDVYVMNADGSNERCVTSSGPKKHNGNPVWHPSGKYIVFTAENEDTPKEYDSIAIPGRGVDCNLWIVTSDGKQFWQLTTYPTTTDPKGVLHPQFSHDGKKLLWAERLKSRKGTPWGEWALKVADFVIGKDGPYLNNVKMYQPGESKRFYESHAFSPDDTKIMFSGNLQNGQLESGLDIYELELRTQTLKRLTTTFEDWDEHAHYSPDGEKIAWMSSTGFGDLGMTFDDIKNETWGLKLKTELWIMDSDSTHKQQVTFFNGSSKYKGNVIVSDSTWGPDGRIAVTVAYRERGSTKSEVVVIEFISENSLSAFSVLIVETGLWIAAEPRFHFSSLVFFS